MGVKAILPWGNEDIRAWARRVCGRPNWRLCGLALGVLRLQRDLETMTKIAQDLAVERDELKHRLEGLDK